MTTTNRFIHGYGAADRLDGPIARFAYYDELLTDAQVQALSRV